MKLALGTESRKVAMFVPVFIVATTFLWFGKVDQANWVELVKWMFVGLAAGLTAERFAPKA
jgi:hypothetical protein